MKKGIWQAGNRITAMLLCLAMTIPYAGCGGVSTPPQSSYATEKEPESISEEGEKETQTLSVGDPMDAEAAEFYEKQQEVFTELNEKSVGANAELLATLKKDSGAYEYKLNPADYTTSFTMYVRDEESWTPFISGRETTFTVSAEGIMEYSVANKKNFKFTAREVGECVITAQQNGKTATAYVKVLPVNDSRVNANSVEYYMLYLANELSSLESEQKAEYLMNLADYVAMSQASGAVDGNLVNAMAAACLIYPNTYLINNYAALLMSRGQYKEALTWLVQADEANPHSPIILANMGECCYELGDYNMALVYTDMAIAAQPDYGIAHLIQACVYAKRGSFNDFITALFKSAKTTWCELTSSLMWEAYDYVVDYEERTGKMLITKDHLDILMEAVSYGTTSDGRDSVEKQISLPFPAPVTSAALTAEESYSDQANAIYKEIEALYGDYQHYVPLLVKEDARHVYIARFHMFYYEWLIEKNSASRAMFGEEYERIRSNYNKEHNEICNRVDEACEEIWNEIMEVAYTGFAAMLGASLGEESLVGIMESSAKWINDNAEKKQIEIIKIQLEGVETIESIWHQALLKMEEAKMDGYETVTRPIVEEYWQRMNAILGYMTNDKIRVSFEKRVLYTVNMEGIYQPLSMAGAQKEDVEMYEPEIRGLRMKLKLAYEKKYEQATQKAQANVKQAQLQKAKAEKENRGSSYQLGFPPFSPIQVYIGYTDQGNITYGYGAFGHTIIYERDQKTGNTIQTITSTHLAGLAGLGQLDQTVSGLKDLYDTIGGLSQADALLSLDNVTDLAKGQVVGGLPTVDARQSTGVINVYNSEGELIDSSRFRSTSVSGGANLLSFGAETTTSSGKVVDPLSRKVTNVISTKTKGKINIGGFTIENEVNGALPGH